MRGFVGHLQYRGVFKPCQTAVQIGVGAILGKIGGVLCHQAQSDLLDGQQRRQLTQHRDRIVSAARQDEMADNHAPRHHPVAVKADTADLAVHFTQRHAGDIGIIRRTRVVFRQLGRNIFEVGEVDVDQTVQRTQDIGVLIAAAVIDDGNTEMGAQMLQKAAQTGGVMRGGDEVDVVYAALLQRKDALGKHLVGQRLALALAADGAVLTKDTA